MTPRPSTPSTAPGTGQGTAPATAQALPGAPAAAAPGGAPTATQRLVAWVREFLQFGTVGGMAFVIDVGLFNLVQHGPLAFLAGHPNSANVFSATIATLFSWTVNRLWTYRGRTRDNTAKEGVLFAVGNVGGIFIAQVCLLFTHHVLGLTGPLADNIAAYVVGFGLGTAFRFLFYHYVVFTGSSGPEDPAEVEQAPEPPA